MNTWLLQSQPAGPNPPDFEHFIYFFLLLRVFFGELSDRCVSFNRSLHALTLRRSFVVATII